MRFVRWILIAIVVAAAVGASALWWDAQSIVVDIATISRGNLIESFDAVGRSQATHRFVVEAPVSGNLQAIELGIGDPVSKDDIVARIGRAKPPLLDQRSLQVALANQQTLRARWQRAVDARKTALDALQQVQKRKTNLAVPAGQARPVTPDLDREEQARKNELSAAEQTEEQALHELNSVRAQLGLKLERLSFEATNKPASEPLTESERALLDEAATVDLRVQSAGQVLQVFKRSGAVAIGTPLLEVGDLKKLEFIFDVLTEHATQLTVGTTVQLHHWGETDSVLKGRVAKVSPVSQKRVSPLGVEEFRSQVTVILQDGESAPSQLGDGFRVEGTFQFRESLDLVKVPLGALVKKNGNWYVFQVQAGRAIETKVEIGPKNDREATIVSGLNQHDVVILYPANRISNQVRVSYR